MSLTLVHPETCAVLRIETGLHVGKTATQSTLIEWASDARYFRNDQKTSRVKILSGLETAPRALQVREDELLAQGFVKVERLEPLVHHDPWKTWLRAKASAVPLAELWKGLASQEALERASAGVSVSAVLAERVVLKTPRGELRCELPLDPAELGEAPSFLIPLLARHSSIGGGVRAGFHWDPLEGLLCGAEAVEFRLNDDGELLRSEADEEVPVPATVATLMDFVLERLVGAR